MRVALCQIPVSSDPGVHVARVKEAMSGAAAQGADLAVFPEATQVRFGADLGGAAEPLDGPFGTALASAARDHQTALVAGVFEPAPDWRVFNTAVGYDRHGNRRAAYRKIHLYDALGQRVCSRKSTGSPLFGHARLRTPSGWQLPGRCQTLTRRRFARPPVSGGACW